MGESVARFPPWAEGLFKPKRYKVLYGGRGSGKSWAIARALLIRCASAPTRVLCAREVQRSIRDSVHRLLSDQVNQLGLESVFEVLDAEIRCRNGSLIVFSGLSQHTVDSIKSYEGIDLVWVEEAQTVSKRSWDVLIPTIRKPDSEIWMSLNPELESDETYRRFVLAERDDTWTQKANWSENPWFADVLEKERLHALATMSPADYGHVWEGKCKPAVEGAIYFDQIADAEAKGRIREVPYDPLLKVHTIWDLGWNDSMSIILAQRLASEIRVIDYIEGSHRTLSDYAQDLKMMGLNWGYDYLPHDGFSKDFKTGKSAEEILRALGRKVKQTPSMHVENGIKAAREVFPRCYFAKAKTERLIECLKRYRRSVSRQTNEPGNPLHDEFSHGADAFRYLALNADQLTNDGTSQSPIKYPQRKVIA